MILVPLFVWLYVEKIQIIQTKIAMSRGGSFHDERHMNLLHYVFVKLILLLSLKTRNIMRIINEAQIFYLESE